MGVEVQGEWRLGRVSLVTALTSYSGSSEIHVSLIPAQRPIQRDWVSRLIDFVAECQHHFGPTISMN